MKKTSAKGTTSTDELLQQFLAPIIAHCENTRGAAVELAKHYNAGLDKPIPPSNLRRWITADAAKRKPPVGGSLLRLLEAWRIMRGVDILGVPETSIYCAVHGHQADHAGRECKHCHVAL